MSELIADVKCSLAHFSLPQ